MSDLKPPSQNNPGVLPASLRTATARSPEPVPNSIKFRQEYSIDWSRPRGQGKCPARSKTNARRRDDEGLRTVRLRIAPSVALRLPVFRRKPRENARGARAIARLPDSAGGPS